MRIPAVIEASDPAKVLLWIISVPGLAILMTLLVPASIAHSGSVFFRDDLVHKLPTEVQAKLVAHEADRDRISAQIARIDSVLVSPSELEPDSIAGHLALRAFLVDRLAGMAPPVSPIAFYLNPQMLLWPAIYSCLGWLLTVFRPVADWSPLRSRRSWWVALTFATYLVYEWPLWARNFLLGNAGRTVFAYPNADIHIASFIIQEAVIMGFCALLSAFWLYWCEAFNQTLRDVRRSSVDSYKYVVSSKTLDALSSAFLIWQLSSVILAAGFLFFTNFFWELVAKYHDARYLISAVMAHLLWAISWCTLSLPLFVRWRAWVHAKNMALAHSAEQDRFAKLDSSSRSALLHRMQPLSGFGVSVSAITAIASFVLPILQLFF